MKFEVYKDNKRVFLSTEKECLPDMYEARLLASNGYTFKLNNKKIGIRALMNFIKEE